MLLASALGLAESIIAPHLVKEEVVLEPLPPKKEDPAPEYLKIPGDSANSPCIYELDIEDNNDGGSVMSVSISLHQDMPQPQASVNDTASQQPI
ncbi:unnamed protein product [Mucor circinelloides]